MRESEVTGYSEEGCKETCAMRYAEEIVYEAHVNAYVSIYFMFSFRQNVRRVSIMRSDISDGIWTNYTLGVATEIYHHVPLGTWILRMHIGHSPDWLFKNKASGKLLSPTISRAWGIKGKHYDVVIEDDIVDSVSTPEDVIKAIKWYEKAKKEVKSEMELQLVDIMFFNKKTKKIDYRECIAAESEEEAYIIAAQAYGQYNREVHVRRADCILTYTDEA